MLQNGIKKWELSFFRSCMRIIIFIIGIAAIVGLWAIKQKTPTWSKFMNNPVVSAAFSPDTTMLAIGDDKGNITIVNNPYDKEPSKAIILSCDSPIRINALRFHSNSSTLFAGSSDGIIRVWNLRTRKNEAKLSGHSAEILSLSLSKDGKHLFSEATADPILCWSISEKKVTNTIKTDKPSIGTPRFSLSPKGNSFATAAFAESGPTIWSYGAKEIVKVRTILPASKHGAFYCISFSPDGKKVATGTWNSEVIIWDVNNGKELYSFRIGSYPIVSIDFSHDNNFVAAVEASKTFIFYPKLKIWSLLTGNECASVRGSSSGYSVVAFSPDGKGLVTGSNDGWTHYWTLKELIP